MRRLASWPRFCAVVVLLAATCFILEARNRKEILPPHHDLQSFPMQMGDRRAINLSLAPDELEVLGPGQFLLRDYDGQIGQPPVNLFIAFFPSQRSGDTLHSPKNCLPGSGWSPIESGRISVLRGDGSSISINRYVIAKGMERDFVLYWYQAHGRVTASEYWAKIFLVMDAIRMNRTDGALVRVVTPIPDGGDPKTSEARALEFVHQILPTLDNYVPR